MPAPASHPDWDTNGTHTTAIVAGHATDGFASNEIPTSNELNQVLMLIGLWIRWLESHDTAGWEWQLPLSYAQDGNWAVPTAALNGAGNSYLQSTGGGIATAVVIHIPVRAQVGITITDFGAYLYGDGSAQMAIGLYKRAGGVVSQLVPTDLIAAPPAAWTRYTQTLTTPYTVVDGDAFFIEVAAYNPGLRCGNVGLKKGFL